MDPGRLGTGPNKRVERRRIEERAHQPQLNRTSHLSWRAPLVSDTNARRLLSTMAIPMSSVLAMRPASIARRAFAIQVGSANACWARDECTHVGVCVLSHQRTGVLGVRPRSALLCQGVS